MKCRNPFLIKGYRGPEFFCDREEETRKLVAAIGNGRDVTLMAPRRYGKTGLIRNVFHRIGGDFVTVYLDIYSVKDLASFVRMFSSAVVGALDTRFERMGKDVWKFFRSCRPTVTPQVDGTPKFSFDVQSSSADVSLEETFNYLKSRKTECVIAIDEFQQVREFPEKGVEALLRGFVQFAGNAHFIFAGSKKHMMEEMFALPRGPFYQSTQLMSLDVIDRDRYRAFAAAFFRQARRRFDGDAFDRMYERFDGVTWYVQAMLNRTWESPDGLFGDEAVDRAVRDLVEEGALTYHDLFESQPSAAQAVLTAIAREGVVPEVSSKAFVSKHALPAPSTVRSAVADLLKRDLLYRTAAGVRVYDRIFGEWLSEKGGEQGG